MRRVLFTFGSAIVLLIGGLPGQAAAATDRLPDLGMARLADFRIDTNSGHRRLRYSATIVNVGAGAFELHGQRADTTSDMTVTQRIFDDSGGYRDVATGASMYFAGDGHNHWHTRDLEVATLSRLDNGQQVGSLAKHGFCFSDNVAYRLDLPGAPPSRVYTSCGTDPLALQTMMGLSIGWGDLYGYQTTDQWIDITGLQPGRYHLATSVNTSLGFAESNTANDGTWVDLQIRNHGSIRVLAYGPNA